MAFRYRRYITYGIRARVETLGPNWAQKRSYMFYFWNYMSTDLGVVQGGGNIGPKITTKMTQYLVSSM